MPIVNLKSNGIYKNKIIYGSTTITIPWNNWSDSDMICDFVSTGGLIEVYSDISFNQINFNWGGGDDMTVVYGLNFNGTIYKSYQFRSTSYNGDSDTDGMFFHPPCIYRSNTFSAGNYNFKIQWYAVRYSGDVYAQSLPQRTVIITEYPINTDWMVFNLSTTTLNNTNNQFYSPASYKINGSTIQIRGIVNITDTIIGQLPSNIVPLTYNKIYSAPTLDGNFVIISINTLGVITADRVPTSSIILDTQYVLD